VWNIFTRSFEHGVLTSIGIGLAAGTPLVLAGLCWGKPPYWVLLLMVAGVVSLPWVLDSGDRSTGLEGLVMIVMSVVGGVAMALFGLVSRLLWSGDSR
jgi:hypothetical protein